MNWQLPPDHNGAGYGNRRRARRSRWQIAGVVLATVVGLCGLALLMVVILFVNAMNSFGSNK